MDVNTLKWSCFNYSEKLLDIPSPRANAPAVVINSTVYFYGGFDVSSTVTYADMWSFDIDYYTITGY